jgi:hypothetical protein
MYRQHKRGQASAIGEQKPPEQVSQRGPVLCGL